MSRFGGSDFPESRSRLPLTPVNDWSQGAPNERDNDNGNTVRAPTNATLKGWIQPHSELVECETDAQTVQQCNPECRATAFEHQCQVAGDSENKDAVYIMMDVHSGYRFPVNPRQDQAKEPSSSGREDECHRNSQRRHFRFQ